MIEVDLTLVSLLLLRGGHVIFRRQIDDQTEKDHSDANP